jgi:hypothetical protein
MRENLYVIHWTIAFPTGNVSHVTRKVLRFQVDENVITFFFSRFCSLSSVSFPTWGKLIKFTVEVDNED